MEFQNFIYFPFNYINFYLKNENINENKYYFEIGFNAKLIYEILEFSGLKKTNNILNASIIIGTTTNNNIEILNYQRILKFFFSHCIGSKGKLHITLSTFSYKFGISLKFYSKTFLLPEQLNEFQKNFNNEVWIEKPSSGSRGRGIKLFKNLNDINLNSKCIVQKYILNPLLFKGLKFDLRFYVALISIEPLIIYIYNNGLVRL